MTIYIKYHKDNHAALAAAYRRLEGERLQTDAPEDADGFRLVGTGRVSETLLNRLIGAHNITVSRVYPADFVPLPSAGEVEE